MPWVLTHACHARHDARACSSGHRQLMLRVLVVLFLCVGSQADLEILIAPADPRLAKANRGGDATDGSAVVVSTVHAARDAVRRLLGDNPGKDIVIKLAPGRHNIGRNPLELGADDSPAGATVTWTSLDPSSPATISAALPVTGWKTDAARPGVFAAPIPPTVSRTSALRHLWVGGKRAFKPRYYPPTGSVGVVENSSVLFGTDLPYGGYYFNTTALDPMSFRNPTNIEFIYTGRAGARPAPPTGYADGHELGVQSGEDPWTEMRCTVASVSNRSVALRQACWNALPFAGAEDTSSYGRSVRHQPPAYLENVETNFTEPGEWYLDSAAKEILYRPRAEETLADVEKSAITSINSTLLIMRGARMHRWVGVSFEYAVWDPLSVEQEGYVDIQSGQIFNGSVIAASTLQLYGVRNISFTSCEFRHLGGVYAITAEDGSQGVTIENCTFSDCSGGGVKFGSVANCSTGCANAAPSPTNSTPPPGADSGKGNQWWPKPDTPLQQQDAELVVTNCLFESIPTEFHGSNAIFVGYARDVELSHNTILNTSYSAICIGGGWPKKPSYGRNVRVTYNHIVNAMQLLADGGFIYSTSDGIGSTLAYNHLDGDPVQYGGIYHDGGSANWHDTQNVIENVKSSCIFTHGSCANISERQTWCNNTGGATIQGQAHSLSCRIEILNHTNWGVWPAEAQEIISSAGRKSCWPNCPASTPTPSPPCPIVPPPAPPTPSPRATRFGVAVCNSSKLSQRWHLSPGVKVGSASVTNIKSATAQAGCVEITGCAGSSVGTSYGCKPLPKPGTTGKCALNGAWVLNSNHTIISMMNGQCLQLSPDGAIGTATCDESGPPLLLPPTKRYPNKGMSYVRLPQKESCPSGTVLTTKSECAAAFVALQSTLPKGAKDNTRCCNGDDLPYGCTYRTDNDFVFNDNTGTPSSYSTGGWRAVCSTRPAPSQPATQAFVVTVINASAVGDHVTIQAMMPTLVGESVDNFCVDSDAASGAEL